MGRWWPWYVEMHLFFFSHRTLGAMVEKAGLVVASWQTQGRHLHLGYLLSRLSGWCDPLGRWAEGLSRAMRVHRCAVPVNLCDLFTLYARKPSREDKLC